MTTSAMASPLSKHRFAAERGFSVVEGLIAAALLLIVTIGVLPMFTRAIINNSQGRQASEVSNRARNTLEELAQLPYDDLAVTIPDGSDSLVTTHYWNSITEQWELTAPASGNLLYTRTTTVRYFDVSALDTGATGLPEFERSEAIAAPAAPDLKEIEVVISNPDQLGLLGPGKSITLRYYKPF